MTDLLDDLLPPRTVTVTLPLSESDRAMLEHLLGRARPSANGHAGYEVKCSSCGNTFTRTRRPAKGRRAYCDTCRASGEPGADRARDYRARRSAT